jgi:hypothetical protein
MAIQELKLEKVLELLPGLKAYGFSSFVLVDGELNTVSDSTVPYVLMAFAEFEIMKAVKSGFFCDTVITNNDNAYNECDCSSVASDCESCDLMKCDESTRHSLQEIIDSLVSSAEKLKGIETFENECKLYELARQIDQVIQMKNIFKKPANTNNLGKLGNQE